MAAIPIPDVSRVVVGAPGRLTVSAGAAPELLKVIARPAAVATGTASAPARLAFVAETRLAAGTPIEIDIDAEEHTDVVLVPSSAIVHEASQTAVFVAAEGKAQRRVVETGAADADHVEVRSGVKAGELVITRGQAGLPDRAPISLTSTDK